MNEQNTAPLMEEVTTNDGQFDESVESIEESSPETSEKPGYEGQAEDGYTSEVAPDAGQANELEPNGNDDFDYVSEYDKVNTSYGELRSKFNQSNEEYKQQIKDLQDELNTYQGYYNDNYKILDEVNKDEELLSRIQGQIGPEFVSKEDVVKTVEDRMAEQFRIQKNISDFEIKYNEWENANKDVPKTIINQVEESLKDVNVEGLNNDEIIQIMNEKLAFHQLKHQKALGATEEQLRQTKLKQANVGGNSSATNESVPAQNPFARPTGFNNRLF